MQSSHWSESRLFPKQLPTKCLLESGKIFELNIVGKRLVFFMEPTCFAAVYRCAWILDYKLQILVLRFQVFDQYLYLDVFDCSLQHFPTYYIIFLYISLIIMAFRCISFIF